MQKECGRVLSPAYFYMGLGDMFTFKDKIIIISGASSSIGIELIKDFLNDEPIIYALVKSEESYKLLNGMFQNQIYTYICDLSDIKNIIDLPRKLKIEKVDHIINCIGMSIDGNIEQLDENEFEEMFKVNFFSIVNLIKSFSSCFVKGSSILNIASSLGVRCIPNSIGYSVSKAALIHFSKCLALEYAYRGIRVNCISPGYFKSKMTAKIIEDSKLHSSVLNKIPNHRLLEVEEIIPFVKLLISDSGSYITGANVIMDGGLSCW